MTSLQIKDRIRWRVIEGLLSFVASRILRSAVLCSYKLLFLNEASLNDGVLGSGRAYVHNGLDRESVGNEDEGR